MENNELAPIPVGALTQKPLTGKQDKFCVEFAKDFNATAAARRAGYSVNTCSEIGYENLRKPQIKTKIAELVKESTMDPTEIKKRWSDIAKGDLSDYIIVKHTEHRPKVKTGLDELILDIRKQIDFEDNYALEVNLTGDELEAHVKAQEGRRRQAIRYKLELQEDPSAYRIIDGKSVLIEYPELDIIALARDKSQGAIKSFKMGKNGPEVELYAADNALTNLSRIYAMFIDRTEVDIKKKMEDMDMDQLDQLLDFFVAKAKNPNLEISDYVEI
jgi:phage terminase small subunit